MSLISSERLIVLRQMPYRMMYRQIAEQIADNAAGDSLTSVRISSELVLDLEERLQASLRD